jgi:hypothetical protein
MRIKIDIDTGFEYRAIIRPVPLCGATQIVGVDGQTKKIFAA